jgi:hypothetical protein
MLVAADEYMESWPEGIAIAGSEVVQVEAYVSNASVAPGSRFRIALRVHVDEGYHVNSARPGHEHLVPTALEVGAADGVSVLDYAYPEPEEYRPTPQSELLSVYTGEFICGAELQLSAEAVLGSLQIPVALRRPPVLPAPGSPCPPHRARHLGRWRGAAWGDLRTGGCRRRLADHRAPSSRRNDIGGGRYETCVTLTLNGSVELPVRGSRNAAFWTEASWQRAGFSAVFYWRPCWR